MLVRLCLVPFRRVDTKNSLVVRSAVGQHWRQGLFLQPEQHPNRYHRKRSHTRTLGHTQRILACEHLQPVPVLPRSFGDLRHHPLR